MSTKDPRLDEIQARLDKANAEMDRLTERNPGSAWRWSIPANPERDSDLILSASMADVPYLLAELRKAHQALERVEGLHKPVKIYDECDCPDGTHPDEYDYIDCEDYVGCENSLSGVGCQECCVDSWDSLTQECGENHSHSKDPESRCDTIKAIRAAVAAAKGDEQ